MRVAECLESARRAGILQRTTSGHIGQDHDLFGRQDFCGFGHEFDAAKGDDIGIGFGGALAELQRIPDKIGQILNFRLLIIMRQDHRVAFFLQPVDFAEQVNTGKVFAGDRGVHFINSE